MVAKKITWDSIEGKEHPTLSPAFVSNGHVFTSGIIGSNYGTGEVSQQIEDQVHLAIQNLEKVLAVAGSSLEKVFKVTMFISHAEYSKVVNEIYGQYFPQKPARSCVVVAFMDAAIKYELEAVATLE
ncbi:Reactive Intermediate Deaminase A [Lachancea thermotolerans]